MLFLCPFKGCQVHGLYRLFLKIKEGLRGCVEINYRCVHNKLNFNRLTNEKAASFRLPPCIIILINAECFGKA